MSNYEIKTYTDGFPIYEVIEHSTNSWFKIAPVRGGIVISYGVQGQELLYLDKETFYDPAANIRGGIPVLFPISGQLTDGKYEWNGQHYAMKNHGVARINPWEVVGTDVTDSAVITLRLASSEETRESFPFDFELLFTYRLKDGQLTIEQHYANRSDSEMPMYPGFHPYFAADRKALAYETDARKLYNYNDNSTKEYSQQVIDLDDTVESVVFLEAEKREIAFSPTAERTIRMTYGKEFQAVVLWSVVGKPFICVEPWMARTNELNRKQELVYVKPGAGLSTFLTISVN
ncbi:aldose epimerase family protein [Paenibacillus cremeus]|uniref:Aldose epimerase n=1 Tax=Paenibacillus cremeus TaxID=2163881 RepID=A0A559K579_9BACL|nr:aldose epimerase [Paenibacillus cremeus]TVY07292.1 aldose epimerase [Paenibacillus cremeus]